MNETPKITLNAGIEETIINGETAYNICLNVNASAPADKDYTYRKDVCFVNSISESNPDDGPEQSFEVEVTLKKGETNAMGIAYTQNRKPKRVWIRDL